MITNQTVKSWEQANRQLPDTAIDAGSIPKLSLFKEKDRYPILIPRLKPNDELSANNLFPMYELMTKTRGVSEMIIGKGTYKTVKKGFLYELNTEGTLTKTPKAVLIIKRKEDDSDEIWIDRVEELKSEIKIMKALSGMPHILPLDASVLNRGKSRDPGNPKKIYQDQKAYLIVPLCDGSLRDQLKRPDLPVVQIASQIAIAIASMHEKGFLHLDIKPENILLKNNEVFLSDFGTASTKNDKQRHLKYVSTYSAPEQAKNYEETTEIIVGSEFTSEKSDSWALGIVLYRLFRTQRQESPSKQALEQDPLLALAEESEWKMILKKTKQITQKQIENSVNSNIQDETLKKIVLSLLKISQKKRDSVQNISKRLAEYLQREVCTDPAPKRRKISSE